MEDKHKHTDFRIILSVHPLLKLEDILAKNKKFSVDFLLMLTNILNGEAIVVKLLDYGLVGRIFPAV